MRIPHLVAAAALLAAAAPRAAAAQTDSVDVSAAGAWSYAGPTAPAFWVFPLGYRECTGPRQSPVDLRASAEGPPLGVKLDYPPANPALLVNTGHTVNLHLRDRATLEVADSIFVFQEMHFHVPAEHLVAGERFAAEIHVVHQYRDELGNRAVLTMFVREGEENGQWERLIANLPGNRGDSIGLGNTDLTPLLALEGIEKESMYSYAGSLTTPRCTPNVRFLVRRRFISLSRPQIEALASAFARNVRPVFPATTPIILHRGVP